MQHPSRSPRLLLCSPFQDLRKHGLPQKGKDIQVANERNQLIQLLDFLAGNNKMCLCILGSQIEDETRSVVRVEGWTNLEKELIVPGSTQKK